VVHRKRAGLHPFCSTLNGSAHGSGYEQISTCIEAWINPSDDRVDFATPGLLDAENYRISRRAASRVTVDSVDATGCFVDVDRLPKSDGSPNSRLVTGWGNDRDVAEFLYGVHESPYTVVLEAIVIGDKNFHVLNRSDSPRALVDDFGIELTQSAYR